MGFVVICNAIQVIYGNQKGGSSSEILLQRSRNILRLAMRYAHIFYPKMYGCLPKNRNFPIKNSSLTYIFLICIFLNMREIINFD
jgi:hypothetical protein